jgi:hypothetical protein
MQIRKMLLCLLLCCPLLSHTSVYGLDNMWDLEAVNSVGFGIHPKVNADYNNPANKVVVEGVVIGGSHEILNPNSAYTIFIQDENSDRGGIQAWAGSWFYGPSMWATLRSTDYIDCQAGDRVRITGFLADAGRGKVVINHRHSNDPALVFTVEVIGHPGIPDPMLISSVSDCNYFDQTRAGGGERYQTRFVMLHGVNIISGTWANNSLTTIADSTGSVGMLLSAMGDFNINPKPSGKLNVVGIFDQEDTIYPYVEGYRVWVRNSSDVASAVDACREVGAFEVGKRVGLVGKVVSRVYNGFLYVQDQTRVGGVRINTNRVFEPGSVLCVQGEVTAVGDEKAVVANHLYQQGSTVIRPVGVTSRTLWAENGLNVNGLLVRCFARVGDDLGGGLYSMTDDAGKTIYLRSNGVRLPQQGTPIAVTAVASTENGVPLLLLAEAEDIKVL